MIILLMICIMRVLSTGNGCVAKENFPITMFEMDNKGILLLFIIINLNTSPVNKFMGKFTALNQILISVSSPRIIINIYYKIVYYKNLIFDKNTTLLHD